MNVTCSLERALISYRRDNDTRTITLTDSSPGLGGVKWPWAATAETEKRRLALEKRVSSLRSLRSLDFIAVL